MERVRHLRDRFRRDAFFAALSAKRDREAVSWRDVARETGVSPSTLSRMARGRDPDLRAFAALAAWLRADVRQFFQGSHGSRETARAETRSEARRAHEAIDRLVATAVSCD